MDVLARGSECLYFPALARTYALYNIFASIVPSEVKQTSEMSLGDVS